MSDTSVIDKIVLASRVKDAEDLHFKYKAAQLAIKEAQENAKQMLVELQDMCPHTGIIYYCDYEPSGLLFGASSPLVMCSVCGLEEAIWHNSDRKLANIDKLKTVTLNRNDFFKQRL